MPVAAGKAGDARSIGYVLERAVASIPKEPVARDGRRKPGFSAPVEWAALDAEDVEPAISIVVQNRQAAPERLGQLVDGRLGVVIDKTQSHEAGIVAEGKLLFRLRIRACPLDLCRRRGLWQQLGLRGESNPLFGFGSIEAG